MIKPLSLVKMHHKNSFNVLVAIHVLFENFEQPFSFKKLL